MNPKPAPGHRRIFAPGFLLLPFTSTGEFLPKTEGTVDGGNVDGQRHCPALLFLRVMYPPRIWNGPGNDLYDSDVSGVPEGRADRSVGYYSPSRVN